MSKKLISARQWGVTPLVLLMSVGLGSQPGSAVFEQPAKEKAQQESVESRSKEESDQPIVFEQSLEVSTHLSLIEERELGGDAVREAEIPDLGTALRSEPGLGAARRGPINLEPQVRGLAEGQLLVLVDGTRTFAAGPARMDSDLSHVGPRSVGTIKVVKGPYALAWGPGALGAIDVETFSPTYTKQTRWGAVGGLSYGDNGEIGDLGVTLWGAGIRWRTWFGHQSREGSDYETGGSEIVPGEFTSVETRWGFGLQLGTNSSFEYRGSHQAQDDVDYPGRLLDATLFRHEAHSLKLDWTPRNSIEGLSGISGTVYSNEKRHRMNNNAKPTARDMPGRMPPFALDVDLPATSDTSGARLAVDFDWSSWSLRAGSDYFESSQNAERTISRRETAKVLFVDPVWPDAEIDHGGAYVQLTRGLGETVWSGTVRWDHNDATAKVPSDFFLQNTQGGVDQSGQDVSAAVSALWIASDRLLVTAGAGSVVRYPTALERYSDRFPSTRFQVAAEFVGGPALEPERALQFDTGLTYRSSGLEAGVDLYYRSIDEFITVRLDSELNRRLPLSPSSVYRYVNGEGAHFLGGEARLIASLGTSWALTSGVSYLKGTDETFDEPAFGMPPLTGTVALRWLPLDRLWIEGTATITDTQSRVASSRLEKATPGSEIVDLQAGWNFDLFKVRGGIRNLFDEEYADHLNTLNPFTRERLSEPGRSLFVGLEFNL